MRKQRDLSCQEWVELVTAYLDGSLSRRVRQAVDRHLAGCIGCRDYLEQMRRTIALTGMLGDTAPPPEVVDALVAAYKELRE